MIMVSEMPRRAESKELRADTRLRTRDIRHQTPDTSLRSQVSGLANALCSMLYATFFLLSYNALAYGVVEHERQDMSQRARAALEEILSTEEFKDVRSSQPSWLSRMAERLFNRLLGHAKWIGTVLEWLFYFIAALVTVLVFVFIAKRFRRLPSFTTDRGILTEPQRLMDPGAMRAQAYEDSQRGNYRRAIRYLYLSLLLYLDRAGLLTYDVGKTNGEYLSEIYTNMGETAEDFVALTLFFERKWYGMEQSSAGDFLQCEETFARLTGQ